MKDRLEEFVRSHKEEFDVFEPSDELWGKIEQTIKPQRKIRWTYYLSRAAVVAVIDKKRSHRGHREDTKGHRGEWTK